MKPEFEIRPEFKLKDYKGIKIEVPDVNVEDADVDQSIEHLRDHFSVLHPSQVQKPEKGMFAVVEMGIEMKDGKKEEPKVFTIEVGADKLLPDLEKGIMAMTVGDKKVIKASFPKEYGDPNFAGKEADFDCNLLELKRKKLPELNDAFAEQVKKGSTMLSLRGDIRKDLEARKDQELDALMKNQIMDKLLKNNGFPVPDSMINEQSQLLRENFEKEAQQAGQSLKLSPDQEKAMKQKAELQVRSSFILHEIAKNENLKADDAKLQERVQVLANQLNKSVPDTEKWLKGKGLWGRLSEEVLIDQVFGFLVSHCEKVSVKKAKKSKG